MVLNRRMEEKTSLIVSPRPASRNDDGLYGEYLRDHFKADPLIHRIDQILELLIYKIPLQFAGRSDFVIIGGQQNIN